MRVTVCLPAIGPRLEGHFRSREALFRALPAWTKAEGPSHPCLYLTRCAIAGDALEQGADVLLWIDADMVFTPGQAMAIVEEALGRRAIVGAVYSRKQLGAPLVVGRPERPFALGDDPVPVTWVGLGFCAVHRSVFERIEAPEMTMDGLVCKPWFLPKTDGSWKELLLDDVSFCRRALESGVEVFADPRVRVGHEGSEYRVFYPEDSLK